MATRKPSGTPRKRSGIAAALKFFKPKIVKAKKGTKAYRRKAKHQQGTS